MNKFDSSHLIPIGKVGAPFGVRGAFWLRPLYPTHHLVKAKGMDASTSSAAATTTTTTTTSTDTIQSIDIKKMVSIGRECDKNFESFSLASKKWMEAKKAWLIELESVTNPEQIKVWTKKGSFLWVDKQYLPHLNHGEFYVQELVGHQVFLTQESKEELLIGHFYGVEGHQELHLSCDRWWIKTLANELIAILANTDYILRIDQVGKKIFIKKVE